jgi:hypothetical protein
MSGFEPRELSPDPAFLDDPIRIQSRSRVLMSKNRKKNSQLKKTIFFNQNLQFAIASIKDAKQQEMPSALKREHPARIVVRIDLMRIRIQHFS